MLEKDASTEDAAEEPPGGGASPDSEAPAGFEALSALSRRAPAPLRLTSCPVVAMLLMCVEAGWLAGVWRPTQKGKTGGGGEETYSGT